MPYRTEGLGVDAGLMSFIQDTHGEKFRDDCWHVATKVAVKAGDQYHVSVTLEDEDEKGCVAKLHIKRASNGSFVIEEGCCNLIISDPCYIIGDMKWGEFCNKLHEKEQHNGRAYPLFMEHCGVKLAVSSSGYGDGYYNCNIETDMAGNLKEATITFLGDEDNEDLEDRWSENQAEEEEDLDE